MAAITLEIARKVLDVVDAGLVKGVGNAVPGEMGIEAAVCFALDEPHGDYPSCVNRALLVFEIGLSDSAWSSDQARAAGLRRLALAQLGSKDALDVVEFAERLSLMTVNKTIPRVLRIAAEMKLTAKHSAALKEVALACEHASNSDARAVADASANAAVDASSASDSASLRAAADAAVAAVEAARHAANAARASYTYAAGAARSAARAAYAAIAAARYAASDKELSETAESVVQILIAMDAPGCQWLFLAPREVTVR